MKLNKIISIVLASTMFSAVVLTPVSVLAETMDIMQLASTAKTYATTFETLVPDAALRQAIIDNGITQYVSNSDSTVTLNKLDATQRAV
jgi:deoxycytidylate deaminase